MCGVGNDCHRRFIGPLHSVESAYSVDFFCFNVERLWYSVGVVFVLDVPGVSKSVGPTV